MWEQHLSELKQFLCGCAALAFMQVCALRPGGEKYEESWADAKKMLGNSRLLESLKNYPKVRVRLCPRER